MHKDEIDGSSKTLLLMEISWTAAQPQLRSWLNRTQRSGGAGGFKNIRYDMLLTSGSTYFKNTSIGSQHSGGCNFAFVDSSVRFPPWTCNFINVLKSLSSRAGGEQVTFECRE